MVSVHKFDQFISYIIWYSLARIKIKTENHLKSFFFVVLSYFNCRQASKWFGGDEWTLKLNIVLPKDFVSLGFFSRFIESCLEIVSDYKMISFHLSIMPLWKQKYHWVVDFAENCELIALLAWQNLLTFNGFKKLKK